MVVLTVIDVNQETKSVLSTGTELSEALGEKQVVLQITSDTDDKEEVNNLIEERIRQDVRDASNTTIKIAEEPSFWEMNDPSERIVSQVIEQAEDVAADYIVIGSRKRSPAGKAILGSVAQKVLLNMSVPVVIADQSNE